MEALLPLEELVFRPVFTDECIDGVVVRRLSKATWGVDSEDGAYSVWWNADTSEWWGLKLDSGIVGSRGFR